MNMKGKTAIDYVQKDPSTYIRNVSCFQLLSHVSRCCPHVAYIRNVGAQTVRKFLAAVVRILLYLFGGPMPCVRACHDAQGLGAGGASGVWKDGKPQGAGKECQVMIGAGKVHGDFRVARRE